MLLSLCPVLTHAGGTPRIGLNEDPNALDPARGGGFVSRKVFAAVCDKVTGFVPAPDGLIRLRDVSVGS